MDDDAAVAKLAAKMLEAAGMKTHEAHSAREALDALELVRPDVLLSDVRLGDADGVEFIARLRERESPAQVVLMSAHGDAEAADASVRAGAFQYVHKPFPSAGALVLAVERAVEHGRSLAHSVELERRLAAHQHFDSIVGASRAMASVYAMVEQAASVPSNVLLLGESGTGKELVARAIHGMSRRARKPFLPVNCGAIPRDLVESELFGHARGAFSGAQRDRPGFFEAAHGGTLLLDEVGDLPLDAQVKLLRAVQEGEVRRVGEHHTRRVDARVIAATHRDLEQRAHDGRFRLDLYYRLAVIVITLPPLRERREDISALVDHFVEKAATRLGRPTPRLQADALEVLTEHDWPGNVRELEHTIERLVVLGRGRQIVGDDVVPMLRPARRNSSVPPPPPAPVADAPPAPPPTDRPALVPPSEGEEAFTERPPILPSIPPLRPPTDTADTGGNALAYAEAKRRALEEFDRGYVARLMRECSGNLSEAARRAGLDRTNLRRLMRRLGPG